MTVIERKVGDEARVFISAVSVNEGTLVASLVYLATFKLRIVRQS